MDPLFDFTGKIVLITGGSRGLGYQMVKALADRGADVIIVSRSSTAAKQWPTRFVPLGVAPWQCRCMRPSGIRSTN